MPASSETRTTVALPDGVDLHARPAADFVRTAMRYDATLAVAANGSEADAKSLLSVLALGARAGTTLTLRADGADAGEALAALSGCVSGLREDA